MKDIIKVMIPFLQTIIYVLLTGVIKHDWYKALISAPTILGAVGIVMLIRIKLELMPRGSKYSYFIMSIFIAYLICLIII